MTAGIVAAGDRRTAEAGSAVLKRGGNAADAAVAAAFASFVAEGSVVNIGGGGFATVVDPTAPADSASAVYSFFATMPSRSPSLDMDFREITVDFGSETQPFFIGRASTAVPGVVAGLCRLAHEWGSLPLTELMAPAIALAREGFAMPPNMAYILYLLRPIYGDTPELKRIFFDGDRLKQTGDPVAFPQLAQTLERLAREGPDYFYKGELAHRIARDHRERGGLITIEDLAGYTALRLKPLEIGYRGYRVLLPPPPSQGGVLIAFALAMLESIPNTAWRPGGPEHLTALAHVMQTTNAARDEWDRLADRRNAAEYFLSPEHLDPWRDKLHTALAGGEGAAERLRPDGPGSTTHLSTIDANGMMVAITTSAGESAGYLVGDTGVCLNNILGEHDLHPLGFHTYPPGAQITSMMSPTIVLEGGRPILALGSAGSNRLRTAILQTISYYLDFDEPLESAVNRSRIHYERGRLQVEGGIADEAADALGEAGFDVNRWRETNLFFGGAQAVSLRNGRLDGAADLRRHGSVSTT